MRLRHSDVLSHIFDGATPDELLGHLERLEKYVAAGLEVDAEFVELVLLIAAAEPENRAPAAQLVQDREILKHAQRLVEGRHDHSRPQPDPPCQPGHVGRHRDRRGAEAIIGEMMLGEPGDIEADLLRQLHLIRGLAVDLVRALGGVALGVEAEESEVHVFLPKGQMPTMTSPPLGEITWPVMKSASDEARKATA